MMKLKFFLFQNLSKPSDTPFDHPAKKDNSSKSNIINKISSYYEDKNSEPLENKFNQPLAKEENVNPFMKILSALKNNSNSYPFLQPVNPNDKGASHYFDVIQEPMDLMTVELNYKKGKYINFEAFNADIHKIW